MPENARGGRRYRRRGGVSDRRSQHQVALVGAAFHQLSPSQMALLSDRVNVPLFFKEQFGAEREFDSVEGVVTLRHESYLKNPDARWREKLKGPADRVAWLTDHFPVERSRKD